MKENAEKEALTETYYWHGYIGEGEAMKQKHIMLPSGVRAYERVNSVCCVKDELWYVTYYNVLYKMNIATGISEKVYVLEDNEIWAYWNLLYYDQKIILLPLYGKRIAIYDLEQKSVQYCEVGEKCNFAIAAQIYQEELYFFSLNGLAICCYMPSQNQLKIFKSGANSIPAYAPYGTISSCLIGKKYYFLAFATNILYEYDVETENLVKHILPVENDVYASFTKKQDGLFLFGLNRKHAMYWNYNDNHAKQFCYEEMEHRWQCVEKMVSTHHLEKVFDGNEIASDVHLYERMVYIVNDEITIFGCNKEMVTFDIPHGTARSIELFGSVEESKLFRFVSSWNNQLVLLPTFEDNHFYFSDGRCVLLQMQEDWEKIWQVLGSRGIMQETLLMDLENYMLLVQRI